MERISSRQNPLVKRFRDVARGADGGNWMLLDGAHLLEEALASGTSIEVAAFSESLAAGRLAPLVARTERAGVKTIAITNPVLAAVSPVRQPSGVVALGPRPRASLDDVFAPSSPLVVMLSAVQDPGNVGAIIRAAEACGATGVVVADGTADPFGWKALRGAMGSTFRLPVAATDALAGAIDRARAAGLRVFAATARDGTPLPECDLRGGAAILFGGEGPGLSPDLVEAADERVMIPMTAPVESLNVAIAAALVVYEASRQRSREAGRAKRRAGRHDVSV